VVPTDCLARYVADQLPGATELELAFVVLSTASAGTTNTMLESIPTLAKGSVVRRNGRYQDVLGRGFHRVRGVSEFRRRPRSLGAWRAQSTTLVRVDWELIMWRIVVVVVMLLAGTVSAQQSVTGVPGGKVDLNDNGALHVHYTQGSLA